MQGRAQNSEGNAVYGRNGEVALVIRASATSRLSVAMVALIMLLGFQAGDRAAALAAPATANQGVPTEPRELEESVSPAGLPTGIEDDYAKYLVFKEGLRARYGLDYLLDITLMPQWAAAKDAAPVGNFIYAPWATWTPFADTAAGSGAFTFSLQQNRFWTRRDTTTLQAHAGFLSPPSDWFRDATSLGQLTYTHTLPGSWNGLSMTLGQYSFGLYDQNAYAGNAQTNFVNYALAQDATQAYVTADLGGYVQAAGPSQEWALAAGFQGATNLRAEGLRWHGLGSGKLAYFAAARLAPAGWGGTYSLLWYSQPSIPQQPQSRGISFSAAQKITDSWSTFLRVNTATGLASPISTSVASGVVIDDPFARQHPDQVGIGFAWNKTNMKTVAQPARNAELVVEIYANYAVFRGLKIGPDVQLYNHPALAAGSGPAVIFTLRSTVLF